LKRYQVDSLINYAVLNKFGEKFPGLRARRKQIWSPFPVWRRSQ